MDLESERSLSSTHIRHAIEMVRFILENLDKPLRNAEITAVTGLHENYAIALFSRIMRIPPRQFLVRMRLMRARALLVESSMADPVGGRGVGLQLDQPVLPPLPRGLRRLAARDARPLRAHGALIVCT